MDLKMWIFLSIWVIEGVDLLCLGIRCENAISPHISKWTVLTNHSEVFGSTSSIPQIRNASPSMSQIQEALNRNISRTRYVSALPTSQQSHGMERGSFST